LAQAQSCRMSSRLQEWRPKIERSEGDVIVVWVKKKVLP
jgi:hypothetical protein